MQDFAQYLIPSIAGLLAIATLAYSALRGWRDWIDLKKTELAVSGGPARDTGPSPMARIEVADLKERVRKLEAIASGVEL